MQEEKNIPTQIEGETTQEKGVNRRSFFKMAALLSAGAGVVGTLEGCASETNLFTASSISGSQWKFGIMADTQWTMTDDGKNPNTCSAEIIRQLNAQFINAGVQFVTHVGDLCDDGSTNGEQIRAAFAQTLYNNGIGFFPLRGNHDSAASDATTFVSAYPQTSGGKMNATPSSVLAVSNPDSSNQPIPTVSGGAFGVGSYVGSPDPWSSGSLKGLSYAYDINNVRIVMLDQFTPTDSNAAYNVSTTIAAQQSWITSVLSGKPSSAHGFVFSHKGLMTQNHVDVLLGSTPAQNTSAQDTFINSLANNGVRMFVCGHDHMHDRSLVTTTDGKTNSIMHLVTSSNSSKFYIPANPTNDYTYSYKTQGVYRQTPIAQELNTVGYYIVNVEGNNVTVEFWSSPISVALSSGEYLASTVPTLNFTRRESWGYSLVGQQFKIAQGGSFTTVSDTSANGTTASILAGTNLSIAKDYASRSFVRVVNTGWGVDFGGASDVLYLWGMQSGLGSDQSETYVLQMSYNASHLNSSLIAKGQAGIATMDSSGNWINAVNENYGGTSKFVNGAWNSSYTLGTYGVDPSNNVAWAVINYGGKFIVTNSI